MKVQTAYCSACDRDVRVVWTPDAGHDTQAPITDSECICLEMGVKCTGAMCPVGAQPPAVMAARLVRSGLAPMFGPVFPLQCDRCLSVTSFAAIDASHATCTQCGLTVAHGVPISDDVQ
jgi:hypothetical protein